MSSGWPPEVERVAAFLRTTGAEARIEQVSESATASAAADAIGSTLGQIVKTLALVADGSPLVALVPGDRRIDTGKVARLMGARRVKIADADTVVELTGFAPGGVAPFPLPKTVLSPDGYFIANTQFFLPALTLKWLVFDFGGKQATVDATKENAPKVMRALRAFGAPLHDLVESDLEAPGVGLQIGIPPQRIDVLTAPTGLVFEEAWPNRVEVAITEDLVCPFVGRDDLLRNKRAAGRPQDLADVVEHTHTAVSNKKGLSEPPAPMTGFRRKKREKHGNLDADSGG